MVTHGVYHGEFFESPECRPDCWENITKGKRIPTLVLEFLTEPTKYLAENSSRDMFIAVLQVSSILLGVAVVFFSCLAGFTGKLITGQIPILFAGILILGALPGAQVGSILSPRTRPKWLRLILAVVIAAAALRIGIDVLSG